jgi:hypothetical protein
MQLPCRCNRNYQHCASCGSRNIYVLMNESEIRSARADERVQCYRCKRCMAIFDDNDECKAPKKFAAGSFHTAESPIVPNETPKMKVKRLLDEKKTPEQVREIMAEEGVTVNLVDGPLPAEERDFKQPEQTQSESAPEPAPFSMSDVIAQIEKESK